MINKDYPNLQVFSGQDCVFAIWIWSSKCWTLKWTSFVHFRERRTVWGKSKRRWTQWRAATPRRDSASSRFRSKIFISSLASTSYWQFQWNRPCVPVERFWEGDRRGASWEGEQACGWGEKHNNKLNKTQLLALLKQLWSKKAIMLVYLRSLMGFCAKYWLEWTGDTP